MKRARDVLLDEHDRGAGVVDALERLEDELHHHRRQPQARLVEQEQAWPRHEPAPDRAHLLLAAREGSGQLPLALAQPRDKGEDELGPVRAPSWRWSRTVSVGKSWRPSGTCAMPRATIWAERSPSRRAPSNSIRPARTGKSPLIARRVVVLPAPLPPISATASPGRTSSETPAIAVRSP